MNDETNGTPTQDAYDAEWRRPSKPFSPIGVFDWLKTQALFVPEAAIVLEWLKMPNRPREPKPYLLRARVAGDTIRDLIEALQQLDPDLKHGVEEVVRGSNGTVDGLGVDPISFAERINNLEEELSDEETARYRLREVLEDIRDAEQCSVQVLQNLAREVLL